MDVRIPLPSSMAVTNLLGALGLVAIVVAVGLLAGFAWALLGAGVIGVSMSVLAQTVAVKQKAAADELDKRRAGRAA